MEKLFWQCNLLAVNKNKNISSAKLVEKVKKIIQSNVRDDFLLKVGHGGTLDETATGVLVMGTLQGCKLLPSFLHGKKQYQVQGCLGVSTETYNETGKIIAQKAYDHVSEKSLKEKLKEFKGLIWQVPPKYSALKIGGRRIADLTREGVVVDLSPRRVMCYSVNLLAFEPPLFSLDVTCGSGFYVRSLIHDLGQFLGTYAHVTDLHRTRHGFLTEKDAVPPDNLTYENLLLNARLIEEKNEFKKMKRRLLIKRKNSFTNRMKTELWIDPT